MSNPEETPPQKITRLVSSEQVSGLSAWSAQALMTPEEEQKRAAKKAAEKAQYEQDYKNGLDKGYKEGFAKGQSEGFARAKAEGEAQIRQQVASLEQVIDYFSDPYSQLDEEVTAHLVALVKVISERVVQRELSVQPETILNIVKEGLKYLPQTHSSIRVFLNPKDAQYVQSYLATEPNKWTLVEDSTLAQGNCRIDSESTRIDATLATQIQHAIDALLNPDEDV